MRLPSFPRSLLALGLGLVLGMAEPPGAALGATSPVVARVGSMTITAADLERRMALVPAFQLKTFGSTPAEIRRNFLDRVLVRELLLSQGGADRGADAREDVKERIRNVLRNTLLAKIRMDAVREAHVDEAEVKAFYEKNAAKFRSPERVALWIIVTHKRDEAKEVIDELKKDPSPRHWTELARSRSIDGATGMRGGNLGFVAPDGTTPEPGLKVSPAVMAAVGRLKDAEISPDPVEDGGRWVVVWRKQTMKAVERSLDVEAGAIKQMLLHMATDAKVKSVIAALRKDHLTEYSPDLLDLFEVTPGGDLTPVRRPGSLPGGKHAPVSPVPLPGSLR